VWRRCQRRCEMRVGPSRQLGQGGGELVVFGRSADGDAQLIREPPAAPVKTAHQNAALLQRPRTARRRGAPCAAIGNSPGWASTRRAGSRPSFSVKRARSATTLARDAIDFGLKLTERPAPPHAGVVRRHVVRQPHLVELGHHLGAPEQKNPAEKPQNRPSTACARWSRSRSVGTSPSWSRSA